MFLPKSNAVYDEQISLLMPSPKLRFLT